MKIPNFFSSNLNKFKKLTLLQKLTILTLVFGLSYIGYKQYKAMPTKPVYTFGVVENGSINNIVSETGEITATGRTEIKSTIKGIVKEVYVKNGDLVEKGQDLFYVTSSATPAEQASAWANYQSAINALESAKQSKISSQVDLFKNRVNILDQQQKVDDMNKQLSEGNSDLSQNQIDSINSTMDIKNLSFKQSEKAYQDADKAIAAAQSKVNSAWIQYQATIDGIVKSPISGYVSNLAIAPGQNVDVTTSDLTAANALIIKSKEEQTWVKITVNEMEIAKIKTGQNAKITVDALNSKTFDAEVVRVDDIGTNNSGIVTFGTYLVLKETSPEIKPGMTVQVDITVEHKDNVLIVKNTAIKDYLGEKAVKVLDPKLNQPVFIPITTGISDDINTEVKSGLTKGQQIILNTSNSSTTSKTTTNQDSTKRPPDFGGFRR